MDVVSSQGWLTPALAAMDLSQMVTQALWDRDSILMQLPHVSRDTAAKCTEGEVESVFDLIDMKVGGCCKPTTASIQYRASALCCSCPGDAVLRQAEPL